MGGYSQTVSKVTDISKIVSGQKYYIGATIGGTDYYLSLASTSLSESVKGTGIVDKAKANTFIFDGSGKSWTIKIDGTDYYLSLKTTKDNGNVQVVKSAVTFTLSNQNGLIRITKGSYSIQKNNNANTTNFGSYNNSQKDVWLESVETSSDKTATTLTFPKESFSFATTDDLTSFTGQKATLTAEGADMTGKTITYSKTGNDIFTSFDGTTGALVLNGNAGTATVKANFAGDDTYASSTASYTVTVKEVIKDIATLKTKIKSTSSRKPDPFNLKLTNAIVTYKSGDKAYIQDETGGIYCTVSGFVLQADDKVNGIVEVKAYKDRGQNRINYWKLAADAITEHNAEFTPEVVTIAQLNADIDKYENMRVKVIGATANAKMANDQTKITQDGETIVLYDKGYSINWDFKANDILDIEGYPINYSNNTKEILVYRKGDVEVNSSVVKTTLSFDPATKEYNVDNNNKDAFTAPTATVKDAEGNVVEGAAITYTSSKPSVATVGETDGKLTFVGFGTTVITANYAGDATHMASSNSYTINYGKVKTTMSWSAPTATANLGETSFDAPTLTLKAGDTDILAGKTIIYSSSATDVAKINAEGTVTINAEGTTVITATFEGDDTYAEASASYTLTVTDPNKLEVTFDFTKASDYGYNVSTGTPDGPDGKGDVPVTGTIKSGIVTITNLKNSTTANTTFYADNLRIYKGAETSISVPEGYVLKKITSDVYIYSSATWSNGNKGTDDKEWVATEDVNSVTFTANSSIKMANLTVYYAKVDLPTVTFDEEKDDNYKNLSDYDKKTVDVTMKRTIGTGYLNPVCFPFAMDATQITEVFGEGSKVSSMSMEMPDGNLHFDYVETMEAGKPYLVEPTKASTTIEIKNVKINAVDLKPGSDVAEDNDGNMYLFQGTFEPYAFTTTDGTELFLGKDNTLYMPQSAGQRMKGFRAYFTTTKANGSLKVVVNGQTTTISSLMSGKTMTGKVYNLNGQYVGTSLEGLAKGVYVMNGQKFVVK